jgi:KaiC/GvpD/RAD55 family RecA-like ATPase
MTALHAIVTDVASVSFYNKLESLCDGIVEFKSEDRGGVIERHARIPSFRGRTFDPR